MLSDRTQLVASWIKSISAGVVALGGAAWLTWLVHSTTIGETVFCILCCLLALSTLAVLGFDRIREIEIGKLRLALRRYVEKNLRRHHASDQQHQEFDSERDVVEQLQTIRAVNELFFVQQGRYPNFKKHGWDELLNEHYLVEEPVNLLSPQEVQSEIVVVEEPGAKGSTIPRTSAGWVWNQRNHDVYAAGYDW